jgi:pSer/pThr/pTyr-binding forkhead associated (FHA) protein
VPCLVWDTPSGRQVFDLSRAVLIVGRDTVADLVVEDATVSRRHALLQNEDGVIRITDLGSSSGTKINGAKITPDLPSSLEPGDFIQIGRVVFTFHQVAPPVAPPAARAPESAPPRIVKARPEATEAPEVADRNVWKWVALAAAFVLVAVIGALIAVIATKSPGDSESTGSSGSSSAKTTGEGAAPTDPRAEQSQAETPPIDEDPKPLNPNDGSKRDEAQKDEAQKAPIGELPPAQFCSPSEFPDLLELDGDRFFPVRITNWDGRTLSVIGRDGRAYDLPQASVRRSTDRIDLARRAARSRAKLDRSDVSAHLDLAKWCARRFIKSETRTLAQRVLTLRPTDPEAARLLRSTE